MSIDRADLAALRVALRCGQDEVLAQIAQDVHDEVRSLITVCMEAALVRIKEYGADAPEVLRLNVSVAHLTLAARSLALAAQEGPSEPGS